MARGPSASRQHLQYDEKGGRLKNLFVALVLVLPCVIMFDMMQKVEKYASENKELRLRDSARNRFKGLKKGSVDVHDVAAHNAGYNLGTPPALLEAVRRQEHGSTLWELGHQGKTEWIALGIPPDEWQYHEAARTLNKALWRWAWADPIRRREAIKALGKAYTAEHHAKRWAKNVDKLERGKE